MDRSDLGQDGLDFELRTVNMDLQFTAGTSGAVPTTFTFSKGIKSVVLTSTEYLVTFQDVYGAFLNLVGANVLQATPSATTAQYGEVTTVNVGAASTSPNTVGVTFKKGDGTATALSTGDIAYITFRLKR
jgi:hypothetical protein